MTPTTYATDAARALFRAAAADATHRAILAAARYQRGRTHHADARRTRQAEGGKV